MTASAAIKQHQSALPLEIFRECAEDYAWFYQSGLLEKADAVDCAQRHAELWGVVDLYGQDAVQAEMAAAFTSAEPMSTDCAAQILWRWEMADPRDRCKWTGEAPPSEIVRNSDISAKPAHAPQPYCTPQATIDAFKYIVSLGDREHLARWLAQHPLDAPELHKIWKNPPCPQ
jgi:hypothetical protein